MKKWLHALCLVILMQAEIRLNKNKYNYEKFS